MEMTSPPNGAVHVKFLSTPEPPRMRRINLFIEEPMNEEIRTIADCEELDFSSTIRELLTIALRYYKFRQGTLNPHAPQNSKMVYCQVCGGLTKVRYMHTTTVLNEEYKFCEDCFFTDKYKNFIITMINRS